MRPVREIDTLPFDLRQQLLAMPLSETELTEVVEALVQMDLTAGPAPKFMAFKQNAPRPDWQRGV